MAEKKPDTVGAFLGLITEEGKLRMQMRVEESSITGISYKGDFELTGSRVKEKDLHKVLTPSGLLKEAIRETKEELGITVIPPGRFSIYRAVYEDPKTHLVDWALMIPIPPECWDETVKMGRKTVDVDPDQLNVLGELMLVVSGRKRMWRMGQGAIYDMSSNLLWRRRAEELLTLVKPDWQETEYFEDANLTLVRFQTEIGLL
jgi:ADP-ribose pyrophosphatase YjhB (NUDIX family)